MKTLLQKYTCIVALICLTAGCDADISGSFGDDPDPGIADFSTFVVLGDSFTAGYADCVLYRHGQENSFPAIMAQQFTTVGGGSFNQPRMPVGATGSLTLTAFPLPTCDPLPTLDPPPPSDRLWLVPTGDPDRPAEPASITPTQSTEILLPPDTGLPYNNMGVPGAKSYHLDDANYGAPLGVGVGSANPYFVRFASSATTSMLTDATPPMQVATFFVLWIGNNDVLAYATSGGVGVVGAGLPPYGDNDITPAAQFAIIYDGILTAMNTPTNKGVLVNIPDVTTMPYFTTVPYNAIPLTAAEADQLNMNPLLIDYNSGVTAAIGFNGMTAEEAALRQVSFSEGQNRILILDEALTNLTGLDPQLISQRQATADDYILLPTLSKLGVEQIPGNPTTVWGLSNPLIDGDVLTADEVSIVDGQRTGPMGYNATIKAAADADPDLLLFDADAFFTELSTTGILYGSGGISSTFGQGGGISLDGIHPTARGYAVIANEMFKLINAGFGGYIPPVDPSDYTTVFYQ